MPLFVTFLFVSLFLAFSYVTFLCNFFSRLQCSRHSFTLFMSLFLTFSFYVTLSCLLFIMLLFLAFSFSYDSFSPYLYYIILSHLLIICHSFSPSPFTSFFLAFSLCHSLSLTFSFYVMFYHLLIIFYSFSPSLFMSLFLSFLFLIFHSPPSQFLISPFLHHF
ncbi:unnamed protein product [Acanthosepion pharaonis]|uniref:Uncharacterized protein n=1 Tax=Acanthosepion pharaonis TaxID=158019 RepID=A0A812CK06_ACAPH|nr:unnamed protein product [Sepia pharaonis]